MYKYLVTIGFIFMGLAVQAQERHEDFKTPAQYHLTWQRLLLQLSSTYYTVVKEGQVDLDNSLLYASHSLGLSRLPIIAEGIDDQELLAGSNWIDIKDPKTGIKLLASLKGRQHLELLVLIGAYYAFQPYSYQHCKDSVLYYLNNAIKESRALHDQTFERLSLCLMGKMYVQANDLQHGDAIFTQLVKECHDAADVIMESKAWAYRGLYSAFTPASISTRILYLQKARELYHSQGNTEGEINALTNICYLKVASHKLDDAYKAAMEALGLEESIHFPYTHYNTDAIAMVTIYKNEFGEPLKYSLESVRTAEATRDSIGWGYFYSRLETLYAIENNSRQESIKWGKKALYKFLSAKEGSYLNLYNLTAELLSDSKPKEIIALINQVAKITPPATSSDKLFYYLILESYYNDKTVNQFSTAEIYLFKAASVEKQIEKNGLNLWGVMMTYKFGNFYFNKGEYLKAKYYFKRYLAYPSKTGNLDLGLNALAYLVKIDSLFNDANTGLQDLKQYSRLRDSSFAISKIRQAEELGVKYATEEKENQIALLNKNEKLEQANLKQAGLVEDITIGNTFSTSGLLRNIKPISKL
jgi:two-component system, sensor histidine kinase PdtaS